MKKYLYSIEFPLNAWGTFFVERDKPNLTLEELERTITDEEVNRADCQELLELYEISYHDVGDGLYDRRDWCMPNEPKEITGE